MNTDNNLQVLAEAMQSIVNANGVDACIAYCESVYSSTFRTDSVVTLNDFDCDCDCDPAEVLRTLTDSAAEYLAVLNGVVLNEPLGFTPSIDDEDFEYYPDPGEMNAELIQPYKEQARALVLNNLEFVILVNYKGEEAGYMVKEAAQSLSLYKGKYNYV
ncbi:hypothetical protein XaC1_63 [Xanthomonas phage XaC1]|nr:hypothetical protein XaC1_63 [Xanthomonas phage XaC1]